MSKEEIDNNLLLMKNLLSKKGYKSTSQRDKIARWIFSSDNHFTVDELISSFKNKNEKISTATAYRVINLLLELNMIIEHDFGKNEKYYESAIENKDHDHLVCIYCNKVIEFQNLQINKIKKQLQKYDFEIKSYSFKVYGVCPECKISN